MFTVPTAKARRSQPQLLRNGAEIEWWEAESEGMRNLGRDKQGMWEYLTAMQNC